MSPAPKIAFVVLLLVVLAVAIQMLAALVFFGYCDENLRPGTARETVCHAADDGGYVAGVVLPPAAVLIAGLLAYRRRRTAIVVWVFLLAVAVGMAVPLTTALVAGYR